MLSLYIVWYLGDTAEHPLPNCTELDAGKYQFQSQDAQKQTNMSNYFPPLLESIFNKGKDGKR